MNAIPAVSASSSSGGGSSSGGDAKVFDDVVSYPPLRVGIMSTARIAEKNVQAMHAAPFVTCVAVASRTLAKAEAFAQKWNVPRAIGSYQALLDDADIEAVYIPLPTALHVKWAIAAARAGKHILLEKPCAPTLVELTQIVEACREAEVLFMDGVMFMHATRLPALLKAVPSVSTTDTYGMQCLHIESAFSFPADANFLQTDIRVRPDGDPLGCVGDLGYYNARFALAACGWTLPLTVACTAHRSAPDAPTIPIDASVHLDWGDGRHSNFHCSFLYSFRQWARVAGPSGELELDDFVLTKSRKGTCFSRAVYTPESYATEISRAEDTTQNPSDNQEANMWARFARLVREGGGYGSSISGSGSGGSSGSSGGSGGGSGGSGGGRSSVGSSSPVPPDAASAEDNVLKVLETWDFWPRVALRTQAIMDACMESAYKRNGAPVDVVVPSVDK